MALKTMMTSRRFDNDGKLVNTKYDDRYDASNDNDDDNNDDV